MSKHDSRHYDLRLSATNYLEGKDAPVPAEQTAAFFAQHVVQLIDELNARAGLPNGPATSEESK